MYRLSVVVTAYQAEKTIGRAIQSVLNTSRKNEIEVIVVDDCSNDRTCEVVGNLQKRHSNIRLYSMPQNTGSPSEPRNLGIEKATSDYITFFDDDDEIIADSLLEMLDIMNDNLADFTKGYLICQEGDKLYESNRLPMTVAGRKQTIEQMIALQSMTQDFIVKKSLLLENNLRYPAGMNVGEDTIFIISLLKATKNPIYIDKYFLIYHKTPQDITNLSSTQKWGDKEILNQIGAWKRAEQILDEVSISYYKLRLPAAFRNLLLSMVRYSNSISEKAYQIIYQFSIETRKYVSSAMNLGPRYQELYDAIIAGDYNSFLNTCKRRILIAGYDLKFILPIVPYLEDEYNIKIDEWTGHNSHNEKQSKKLGEWADIIWCEWMLGNAVYYSKLKSKYQQLIIRAHRFEITREFGFEVNYNKVNVIFFVGYFYFEQFIKKFSIPRAKARLLSNYVEESIYSTDKNQNSVFHIGLVGILPARKGFMRGLELLNMLKKYDSRYQLYIMGQSPKDVSWIKNNPSEMEYFNLCDKYIEDNSLENNVIFAGFVERANLYKDIGFILSLSDPELPESFHLSLAEGACAGCVGYTMNWPGVEYIYPENVMCKNLEELKERILSANSDELLFQKESEELKSYVLQNYSMEDFLSILKQYLFQVRIMG